MVVANFGGRFLLVAALALCVWGNRGGADSQHVAEGGRSPPALAFPCDKLRNVVDCETQIPKLMHSGSVEKLYLGKDMTGRKVVMKLMYATSEDEDRFVLGADLKSSHVLHMQAKKASVSCKFARHLHAPALEARDPGWQRIVNCYGDNVNSAKDDEPIYTMLEYCGHTDLQGFVTERTMRQAWSITTLQQVFKQILEGLRYLASNERPYTHHNVKAGTIVVETDALQQTYAVHLVDLDRVSLAQEESRRNDLSTSSTAHYAPPEWFMPPKQKLDNASFDMYSAGIILVELMTGKRPELLVEEILPLMGGEYAERKVRSTNAEFTSDAKLIAEVVNDERFLSLVARAQEQDPDVLQDYVGIVKAFGAGPARKFLEKALRLISFEPEARPSAEELLEDDWLKEAVSFSSAEGRRVEQELAVATATEQESAGATATEQESAGAPVATEEKPVPSWRPPPRVRRGVLRRSSTLRVVENALRRASARTRGTANQDFVIPPAGSLHGVTSATISYRGKEKTRTVPSKYRLSMPSVSRRSETPADPTKCRVLLEAFEANKLVWLSFFTKVICSDEKGHIKNLHLTEGDRANFDMICGGHVYRLDKACSDPSFKVISE